MASNCGTAHPAKIGREGNQLHSCSLADFVPILGLLCYEGEWRVVWLTWNEQQETELLSMERGGCHVRAWAVGWGPGGSARGAAVEEEEGEGDPGHPQRQYPCGGVRVERDLQSPCYPARKFGGNKDQRDGVPSAE